ncbi:type II secretion system secretin GspD [Sphingomonas montanisoli]|uniref:Type II secretion system protein GspD n=1 Tax=Sphingomonas montanisoli TaxID=2606412 RepID=A0A5D9CHQ6_9SPHN|nr:type II secretion system secretin GspD [Sphingomonas montanisoli]TZG29651.1 type II secretion system protein GspD [Sphingomonas montanisoli]
MLLTAAALIAVAQPIAAQQVLNLRDADVRAFIQDAARVTGRNFVIDPRVQGKVSVVTDRALSKSEYFELFLSTLRASGLVAVPLTGGAFRIQPIEGAATIPGRIGSAGMSGNNFVTDVIRLRSIDAQAALDSLRPLASPQGSITANRNANSLIIADYADNIRRMRMLVGQLDRDNSNTRLVPLKNAGAREIATALTQLIGGGGTAQSGASTGVSVIAVDSGNALLIRGDSGGVARMAALAEDLDRRAANASEIRVIFLEYADAAKLLPVLQQLVGQAPDVVATSSTTGSAAGAPAPAPAAAATPTSRGAAGAIVTRFDGANAIIIAGPADVQRTLGEVVRQLDTRRDQVLVEAIIVEISNDAARKLGVQFLLGGKPGSGVPFAATNYSNAAPNILTVAGAIGARELATTTTTVNGTTTTTTTNTEISDQLAEAAVSSILNAGGGFAGFADTLGRNAIFGAIINAVQSDTKSNVLSTPSVLTLDNQEAKLLVGQEIPITTGQALSNNFDNQFRTVQRQNVGVQLEVKPQINAGGAIKLFLKQEVSSIAGPVTNGSSDLILNKRLIETTVTVDDGDIIALGGLLDDNERRTIERIPLLSDIPGLGELFKSRSRSHVKTNLMVFIRPTILRSRQDSQRLAAQRYGYIRGEQARFGKPGEEPSIDELVRDYMGAALPVGPSPSAVSAAPAGPPEIIRPSVTTSSQIVRPVDVQPSKKPKQ